MPIQFPQIVKRLFFPRRTAVGRADPHVEHPGADRRPARSGEEALEQAAERNDPALRKGGRESEPR